MSTMTEKEQLLTELDRLPDSLLREVLDFVRFLRTKVTGESLELLAASESSLKKDWLKPEEDAAWRDL